MSDDQMTRDEYRSILAQLGLTQRQAADHLGIALRTAAGYASGDTIPAPTAQLLRMWLKIKRRAKIALPFNT